MKQWQGAGWTPARDRGEERTAPAHVEGSAPGLPVREGRDIAEACLTASYLLRRSVHRQLGMPETARAVSLTTCQLLDALSRALHDDPHRLPPAVAAAALRLSERIAELPPTPHLTSAEAPRGTVSS